MKTFKLSIVAFYFPLLVPIFAQSADEVISKYITTIEVKIN
jgi:hypothetical protein